MGNVKKRSRGSIKLRNGFPEEERYTLVTCPVCDGDGKRIVEEEDGGYVALICKWCDGRGGVTKDVHRLYERWRRILRVNLNAGKCSYR